VIFLSVSVVDAGTLKGIDELEKGQGHTEEALHQYVKLATQFGYAADFRMSMGTEVLDEAVQLSAGIAEEFPRAVFFSGKLIFEREHWYQRILHNETANQFQRRLQFAGLNTMVLPVRVFDVTTGK
jgi:hypothetical protein